MIQSYFCESCTVYHMKSFFFDNCTIMVSLIRLDSRYRYARFLVEVTRYCRGYYYSSNVRFDDIRVDYQSAIRSYLFTVRRYEHFKELEDNKKLRCFEKYL